MRTNEKMKTTREMLRSKSWKSQPEFDNIISDITPSGLQYLKEKYENDIYSFYKTHNLSIDEYKTEYTEMQQRFKMINEELERRIKDTSLSFEHEIVFDKDSDTVIETNQTTGNVTIHDVYYADNYGILHVIPRQEIFESND